MRAPQVVVACGALESPALLLRSGIGGPAAGDYLRLHPCTAVFGYYAEDTQAWRGAPHAGLVHEFENVEDGYGFLIEGAQYTTAVGASAVPWTDGPSHKRLMANFRHGASFIGLLRDHGHGRVTIDADGMAVPSYAITDELDLRNTHRAIDAQVRLHEAAGATQILAAGGGDADLALGRRRRGRSSSGSSGSRCGPAAGSCSPPTRWAPAGWGHDPQTSVADPWGELHDTKGVWIGDGSAFPTSSGTNPMITIMALAHRTAEALAAATPSATATSAPQEVTGMTVTESSVQVRDRLYIGGEWVRADAAPARSR